MKKMILTLITVALTVLFTQCKKDSTKSERCNLEPDAGDCKAAFPRYYYNKKEKKCKQFIWGGCEGVVPFETMEECEKQCDCK